MRSFLVSACAAILSVCNGAPTANSRFTYFNALTPLSGPCDLTTGPDGAIWYDTFLSSKIGRIDPITGKVDEFDIPYTLPPLPTSVLPSQLQGRASLACAIQPGKDGNIYAASGVRNEFVRVNVKTKKVDVFPTGNVLGNLQPFNDITAADDGMYFTQTTQGLLTFFDYKTENTTSYTVPTPLGNPVGVFIPEDGNVWTCEFIGQKIAKFDVQTKQFAEYPVPLSLAGPVVVRAGLGEWIYFTAFLGNSIGAINIYTGELKTLQNDVPLNFPVEDTIDKQGNVWFSTFTQTTLNYVNPTTGHVTHIEQPDTLITVPVSLIPAANVAIHYDDGTDAIWFTDLALNRIGKYQL
ncbi:Hypothetical protein R9X50_00034000 [Acrodontium crateriforme]|uniref:Uncharacterized protein n=1 Tax=Acrodontium crateriforme TaxID=150365 RepID=A0AAQ3LX92_9PEZI|nr:Hypothetical protein R9X50_00034000 [Acrodontium crateriforme]